MEKELEKLTRNCRSAIDSLPLNIALVDSEGIVTYTNKTFEKTFGKGWVRGLRRCCGDLISCENSFLTEEGCGGSEKCRVCSLRNFILSSIREKRWDDSIEVQLTLAGGYATEHKWFEVHVTPTCLEKDSYQVSLLDITYYKEDRSQILESKRAADAANRAKSEFLANMSHEIRTPLNGMIGMLELTLLTELDEEQKENLQIAKNCADTLLILINNILDLSKVESNKVVLENRRFGIREMLQSTADVQTANILDKNVELEVIVDDRIPPYFYGDAFRIQQVLSNLLANAVKFTEQGKITLEVKMLCYAGDSYTLTFSVEDSGIGICQEDLKRLFRPFSQLDGSISRKYGGTGLGLAISQKLVELMGGEIKVKSTVGKGSVFFFTIQIKGTHEKVEPVTEDVTYDSEKKPFRILVVEDEKTNQIVIRKMLSKLGYNNVEIADNGIDGIKRLKQDNFDLVLMDIQMPEMNGVEVTHVIREEEKKENKHMPIVALTACALKSDRDRFLAEGMDDYLSKPVSQKMLKKTLDRIFRQEGSRVTDAVECQAAGIAEEQPQCALKRDLAAVQEDRQLKHAYAEDINRYGKKAEEQKEISVGDRGNFLKILKEMEADIDKKDRLEENYLQIEKRVHELKLQAQSKEYTHLKSVAFRLELAARKKDDAKIQILFEQLKKSVS